MTEGEICRSYREAKWPLRQIQVLADLNATKREAIIEILERKGEIMAKKWNDEDNRVLIERANAGATTAELAKEYGTTVGNIYWRISMLRKKGVQGTTDNPDNTDTTLIGAIAQSEADKTNRQLAELCDTPDPQRELGPIDEAAISMNKSAFEEGPKPVACEPTIFDRAHGIISLLRQAAKDQLIDIGNIDIAISNLSVDAFASNAGGESVEMHKKYQPTECKSED